jgi:hypothetical protein
MRGGVCLSSLRHISGVERILPYSVIIYLVFCETISGARVSGGRLVRV